MSRAPAHADEMFHWMAPLFPDENAELRRMRQAVCLFSDIGWRRHPDDRALGAFNQVLHAPFAGADHRERALIATAIFHRYSGDEDFPREIRVDDLLDEDDETLALRIGLAARLAFALSASAVGELAIHGCAYAQQASAGSPAAARELAGEPVQKRLGALAAPRPQGRNPDRLIGRVYTLACGSSRGKRFKGLQTCPDKRHIGVGRRRVSWVASASGTF